MDMCVPAAADGHGQRGGTRFAQPEVFSSIHIRAFHVFARRVLEVYQEKLASPEIPECSSAAWVCAFTDHGGLQYWGHPISKNDQAAQVVLTQGDLYGIPLSTVGSAPRKISARREHPKVPQLRRF